MPDHVNDSPLCDGDPLARELAALRPVTTTVTPASVLFAAGEQAALARDRHWRTAAIGLGIMFIASWVGMSVREWNLNTKALPTPDYLQHNGKYFSPESAPATTVNEGGFAKTIETAKPVPSALALEVITDQQLEARSRGLRLRQDILAGGVGMIPTNLQEPARRYPSSGFAELNPTVLGGYFMQTEKPKE